MNVVYSQNNMEHLWIDLNVLIWKDEQNIL